MRFNSAERHQSRGRGEEGSRDNGIVQSRVRFPPLPPRGHSSSGRAPVSHTGDPSSILGGSTKIRGRSSTGELPPCKRVMRVRFPSVPPIFMPALSSAVGSAGCKPVVERPWWFDSTRRHHCQALCIGIGAPPLKRVDEGSIPSLAAKTSRGVAQR